MEKDQKTPKGTENSPVEKAAKKKEATPEKTIIHKKFRMPKREQKIEMVIAKDTIATSSTQSDQAKESSGPSFSEPPKPSDVKSDEKK